MAKNLIYLLAIVFGLNTLIGCSAVKHLNNEFSIIQMSDPQFGFINNNESFEEETKLFTKAIEAANRLNPDFVVVTGDLIHLPFDEEQIREYKRIAALLKPSISLYNVAGNHDVGNVPTEENIKRYMGDFDRDYYAIEHKSVFAIVLNSMYLHSPQHVLDRAANQKSWLEQKLAEAKRKKYKNILVFLHHPLFLNQPDEPNQYFNIPIETRMSYLELFKKYGVSHIFSGHYHRNALGTYEGIEMVTSGPVGKTLGKDPSGLRIINIKGDKITHSYLPLDSIP